MITAFKRLNVVMPSSDSKPNNNKKSATPNPSPSSKKRSRPRPQPVKFTYSQEDIKRSEQLSICIDIPPPLKKQRITPFVIYETDTHETDKDKPQVPNCILELFTFQSAEYNNEVRANVYRDCTLVRYVHGIGKPGTYLPIICVEPTKARITFLTSDDKQWRAKIGWKVFDCVLD
jgi:hypothetical protein